MVRSIEEKRASVAGVRNGAKGQADELALVVPALLPRRLRRHPIMPTLAWFYGIAIAMYYNDHNPPHFHAQYGQSRAVIGIADGRIIAGSLPSTALRLVTEWAWRIGPNWKTIGRAPAPISRSKGFRDPMTTEYPMVDVVKVKPMEAFRLWVRFSDGSEGVADLSRLATRTGPMAPLKDPLFQPRVCRGRGADLAERL